MFQFDIMENLMRDLRRDCDDKPITHARAKTLKALCDKLVRDTQPGAGDFKWSARARKDLMSICGGKVLYLAREGTEVWHGDGTYMKRGEPSRMFGDFVESEITIGQLRSVTPVNRGDVVIIVGPISDADLELSNGTRVNRNKMAYALDGHPLAVIQNAGALLPITVTVNDQVVSLVMPAPKV